MKISTKGRYALRMLIDLAQHQNDGYISLKEIAERQGISKKYLEQIIPIFNSADVLRTNRGINGGYRLSRPPEKYTVGEILRLTEGTICPVECGGQDPIDCPRSDGCITLPLWRGLAKVISEYLDGITIKDLIENANEIYTDDYII